MLGRTNRIVLKRVYCTVYSIACKFDALTDMEELHISKVVRFTEHPPHIQI